MRSPLWGKPQLCKNPADAEKLFIDAESDWSKPRMAPKKNAFFASNGGNNIASTLVPIITSANKILTSQWAAAYAAEGCRK